MNEKIQEFITLPKTFENYKWYKPILVLIATTVIYLILLAILTFIFGAFYGDNVIMAIMNGGYEVLNTEMGQIYTDLAVIIFIPSLYLGTKIIKDRPFSSYTSSRGEWNLKLYLKALIIPFILFMIAGAIEAAIKGPEGTYHFSILFLIITLIFVPLQCIAEEYIFRGLVMQTFGSWFNIPILAVILQAIVFGLLYGYNSLGNIEVLVSGIIMGFLAWKANGIEVSSAFHTANNLSIALLVMFGIQSTSTNTYLTEMITAIILILIIGAVMYFVGKKTDWYGEIPENT